MISSEERRGQELARAIRGPTLPVFLFFLLFVIAVSLGTLGAFSRFPVVFVLIAMVWCLGRAGLFQRLKQYAVVLDGLMEGHSFLKFALLFSVVVILLNPSVGGDSQAYHLPSISYMLHSHSTATFDPDFLYHSSAITTWYPRGFEAVSALFYQLPAGRVWIALFKLFLFSGFYLLLLQECSNRTAASAIFVLLCSMLMVQNDLAGLKNDIAMAIPLVYASAVVRMPRKFPGGVWTVPMACVLAFAIKASSLLYALPILLLWAWEYRHSFWRQTGCVVGLLIPFGLYFYWVNWIQTGNPLFPFEVALGDWVLFEGRPNHLFDTTIFANVDLNLPILFIRGLLRVVGPGGILAFGLAILFLCVGFFRQKIGWKSALIFVIWAVAYPATPFSDHNGSDVHNLIYSGNNVRLAFPAILFLFSVVARPFATWMEQSKKRVQLVVWFAGGASLLNLFWYDAVCFAIKPKNVLAWLAPCVRSFSPSVLIICFFVLVLFCVAIVRSKQRRWMGLAVVSALLIQQAVYPESLTHSVRFKQIGQTSDLFHFLHSDVWDGVRSDLCVAIHSADESSFFLCCVNDYLLPRTKQMFYVESVKELREADCLIVCAKDSFCIDGQLQGHRYRLSWDFFDENNVPSTYEKVYCDDFYRVYLKASI